MTKTAKDQIDNVVSLGTARASDAVGNVTKAVRDHPFLVLAGGIAVGAVVAALLPKRTTGKLASSARHLAGVASAAGLTLGREVIEKSSHARDAGLDLGRDISRQARDRAEVAGSELRRHGETARDLAEDAISTAGDAGHKLLRKASEIAGRVRG